VRRLRCEFAQAAGRIRCAVKGKFQALKIRKDHKRSIVALAHKMLRIIYAMLSKPTHYKDKSVDYEALFFHVKLFCYRLTACWWWVSVETYRVVRSIDNVT